MAVAAMGPLQSLMKPCLLGVLLQVLLLLAAHGQAQVNSPVQTYVVYMGHRSSARHISDTTPNHVHHINRLNSLDNSPTFGSASMIYSYQNFDAFAARLTAEQAATLAVHEDVISVTVSKSIKPLTSHSWAFLGLEDNAGNVAPDSLWNKSSYGKDVIIGVVDSGVWPESRSFHDAGLGPVPARWKGECVAGELFGPSYCNNKVIGGRYYLKGFESHFGTVKSNEPGEYISARAYDGHGVHTASIAGGNFAPSANFLGFASGTAKGGAPMSRLAIYKACWVAAGIGADCRDVDILAAMDEAISDGVDVLSLSVAGAPIEDLLAVGAFHAVQYNVSVVAGAGNGGPGTISNLSPWITTVASSKIDRSFPTPAILGNGLVLEGESYSEQDLTDRFYPLIPSTDAYLGANANESALCRPGTLDPAKVSGTIVVCDLLLTTAFERDGAAKAFEVKNAGGAGVILTRDSRFGNFTGPYQYSLPTTLLRHDDALKVYAYMNSTESPVAKVGRGLTVLGTKPAPIIPLSPSANGPNLRLPDILKPDTAAPGVSIIAAWPESHPFPDAPLNQTVPYYIQSGTSMATPHVSGVIASLKAYHPTWSPAALHSAIVTTGTLYDNTGSKILFDNFLEYATPPASPFEFGGGQVNPNAAAEPGLVYDNPPSAYYELLCSLNYNASSIRAISNTNYTCPTNVASVSDFNYPSLTVSALKSKAVVKRSVTNVGNPTSTYKVVIESPPGIEVTITPPVLEFSSLGEVQSFSVEIKQQNSTVGQYGFGSFTWTDGTHYVRSPLVVKAEA